MYFELQVKIKQDKGRGTGDGWVAGVKEGLKDGLFN